MLKKLKFALLLSVMVSSTSLYSQEKRTTEVKYSTEEIETFLKIYKHKLDHPFEIAISMENASKKSAISEERMSEILQAQFAGNEIKLSEKEKNELEKIKALMEIDKAIYDKSLNEYISENKMNPLRYQEIETTFHNNVAFQNKLTSLYNKTN